ncbi:ABC transporter permease [Lactobacillus sp. R2/2]|nr:ABC transporter permease [Lactobacillus sp. R2/2]MEB3364674.1 ABC transporter permease [Lactobacillus sp. R2/2]
MRFHDILNSAATNLWHNKGRTFLTIIAVFIGSLTIAITMGINNGVNDYLKKQVGNVGKTEQMSILPGSSSQDTNEPQKYNTKKSSQNADGMMDKNDVKKSNLLKA